MDKYVSKKHTKVKEFKGYGGHAPFILTEDVPLKVCLHSHSTLQSHTLYAEHKMQLS